MQSWWALEIDQKNSDFKCPAPRIENVPNRDTIVSYRTEPWILWTITA